MKIACSVCGATPYAVPPAREGAILRCVAVAGERVRFCVEHLPADIRSAPRAAAASPTEALAELERVLAAAPHLRETFDDDDADVADVLDACDGAVDVWRAELERALADLKKTLAPPPEGGAAKPRRARSKAVTARERNGEDQGDLVAGEGSERLP
jgi:hypothetical protein